MAGDWIKVEHATATKPEICIAAELLGISRREAIGLVIDYWIWLDANLDDSRHGCVTHVSRKCLEDVLHCPGFAAVLERIRWASFDDSTHTLTVTNWDRHNGKSAKTRALSRDRKQKERHANVTQDARPEKRREEITPIAAIVFKDGEFMIPEDRLKAWVKAYPAIDVPAQVRRAAEWLIANPSNMKSNLARFLTNWFGRAQDQAPARGSGGVSQKVAL